MRPLVRVLVAVPFRQVQIQADRHQASRCGQRPGDRLTKKCNTENGADERR